MCWVIYYFNHTGHPTHPPNASLLYAASPHISEQNCTSWQWCFLIFSTRVNLVKQDGLRFYKYRRRSVVTVVGRPYLCFILALKAAYCNRITLHIRIFPNWQKPGQIEEAGEVSNYYYPRGLEGEGRVKVTKMIKVFLFCFEIFH